MDRDRDLAHATILYLLTQKERFGINELFGQMTSSDTPLLKLVIEIVRDALGSTWEPSHSTLGEAISALNSVGVTCLDVLPSEK